MKTLEAYKMITGYYDTARIRIDAGVSERRARFDDIFGGHKSSDDFQPVALMTLPGEWQTLFEQAVAANEALHEAEAAEHVAEAVEILAQPVLTRANWVRLHQLGYATRSDLQPYAERPYYEYTLNDAALCIKKPQES